MQTDAGFNRIISTEEPAVHSTNTDPNQGRIEVYSLASGFVQVPTEIQRVGWLVHQILGSHSERDLFVSPTFGTAKDSYFKPVDKLRIPIDRGSCYHDKAGKVTHWSTEEDAVRYWMLNKPEFVSEMVSNGWMHFPRFNKVDGKDFPKLHPTESAWDHFAATLPLGNLIKILERDSEQYGKQAEDLSEVRDAIGSSADNASFVFRSGEGHYRSFFSIQLTDGLLLTLGRLNRCFPDSSRDRVRPAERTVHSNVYFSGNEFGFSAPEWWTKEHSSRVSTLLHDYSGVVQIGNRYTVSDIKNGGGLVVSLHDANYLNDNFVPDTRKLIAEAAQLREFARKAVVEEHRARSSCLADELNQRRARLSLPVPVK